MTKLTVKAHQLSATVKAVAPGAGTPSGKVTFRVDGAPVGQATLANGVATLNYTTPAGKKLLKDGPISIRELSKAGDIWATGITRDMSKATDDELEKKIDAQVKASQKTK